MKTWNCFKRILALTLSLTMMLSLGIGSASAATAAVPAGASFELMKNVKVTGSAYTPKSDYSFYLYSPSKPHDFDMMSGQLNAVIYVYPDKPYASSDEAYAALVKMGLIDIAEKAPAYIVMPNPLNGKSWTADDLNVYYESQFYLAGGKIVSFTPPTGEYPRRTYNNLQYVIAEGSGSTFVNDVLSQHAGRMAGILTFGGSSSAAAVGEAVPAYLVNASDSAVAYWKKANGTDAQNGNTYYNSGYEQKKVTVAAGSDTFSASLVADAWASLLSRSTRACMSSNVVINTMDMSEWTLMTWPNYSELGLTLKEHTYNYQNKDYTVYDYVPSSYTGKTAVPLVVLLHGFTEDPLCPAATCGWADKAAQEGFILVAPDYLNDIKSEGVAVNAVMQVVKQAQSDYNIDASRIYLTGFSMGGMNTMMTAFQNAGTFAAVAPMAGSTEISKLANYAADSAKYDLPTFFLCGTVDTNNVKTEDNGSFSFTAMNGNILPSLLGFSGIKLGTPDYAAYPGWGYKADQQTTATRQNITYQFNDFYVSGYTSPMAELVTAVNVAHACSNVYADFAWNFMSRFSRAADGSLVDSNKTFSDVQMKDWFYTSTTACAKAGILSGYNGAVRPTATVTRAEAAKMIVAAAGVTVDQTAVSSFGDVASSKWYSPYIAAAEKSGLMSGVGGGKFAPDATLTRAQVASLIVKAKKLTTATGAASFSDVIQGAWYASDVAKASAAGYLAGVGNGTFAPARAATRAEFAQVIYGMYLKK